MKEFTFKPKETKKIMNEILEDNTLYTLEESCKKEEIQSKVPNIVNLSTLFSNLDRDNIDEYRDNVTTKFIVLEYKDKYYPITLNINDLRNQPIYIIEGKEFNILKETKLHLISPEYVGEEVSLGMVKFMTDLKSNTDTHGTFLGYKVLSDTDLFIDKYLPTYYKYYTGKVMNEKVYKDITDVNSVFCRRIMIRDTTVRYSTLIFKKGTINTELLTELKRYTHNTTLMETVRNKNTRAFKYKNLKFINTVEGLGYREGSNELVLYLLSDIMQFAMTLRSSINGRYSPEGEENISILLLDGLRSMSSLSYNDKVVLSSIIAISYKENIFYTSIVNCICEYYRGNVIEAGNILKSISEVRLEDLKRNYYDVYKVIIRIKKDTRV